LVIQYRIMTDEIRVLYNSIQDALVRVRTDGQPTYRVYRMGQTENYQKWAKIETDDCGEDDREIHKKSPRSRL